MTGANQGVTSVLFDLDGTLIDSVPDVRAAINRALEDDGRRALSLDEVKGLVGEGAQVLIERALALTGTRAPRSGWKTIRHASFPPTRNIPPSAPSSIRAS